MTFPTPFPFNDGKYKADFENFCAAAFAPAMMTGAMMLEGYNIWWKMALGMGREMGREMEAVASQAQSSVMVDVAPEMDASMDGALATADFDVLDEEEAAAAAEDAAIRKQSKPRRPKEQPKDRH